KQVAAQGPLVLELTGAGDAETLGNALAGLELVGHMAVLRGHSGKTGQHHRPPAVTRQTTPGRYSPISQSFGGEKPRRPRGYGGRNRPSASRTKADNCCVRS